MLQRVTQNHKALLQQAVFDKLQKTHYRVQGLKYWDKEGTEKC